MPIASLTGEFTLEAQLCSEYRRFFPHNAVEYFVSYYDYYHPKVRLLEPEMGWHHLWHEPYEPA